MTWSRAIWISGKVKHVLTGIEIQTEAFDMFEKWRMRYASNHEGDILELIVLYMDAPPEQHAEAARLAGLTDPRFR